MCLQGAGLFYLLYSVVVIKLIPVQGGLNFSLF